MGRDELRESLWLLAGVAVIGVGAAFLFGTRKGRTVLRRVHDWAGEGQKRLAEVQELLERSERLFERGRELLDETRDVASQGRRIVRAS